MFFKITGKEDMVQAGANTYVMTQDAVKGLIQTSGQKM